jgi:hypothetical protein
MYLNFIDFLNSFAVDFQKLFPAVRCSFARLKKHTKAAAAIRARAFQGTENIFNTR